MPGGANTHHPDADCVPPLANHSERTRTSTTGSAMEDSAPFLSLPYSIKFFNADEQVVRVLMDGA